MLVSKRLLFGFKTFFPVEKRRSTAALEGIGVLNLINKSSIVSLEKTLKSKCFNGGFSRRNCSV